MRPFSTWLTILTVALLTFSAARAAPGEPAQSELLPAWELERELKVAGKADEWDDYRELHPEWFGVTAPPVVAIRPFAEYEPTQAVLLRPSKSISKFHKEILKGLHGHVDRIAILHVPGQVAQLDKQLKDLGMLDGAIDRIDIGEINANWTRDYGPLSVVAEDNRIGLVDFRYYHGRAYDDAIPAKVGVHWGVQVFRPSLSLEGGNFMADPQGTCYATEKLYNQNAGYSQSQVTEWFLDYMGCTQMVILKLPEKLGTGHIDMFSKLMDDRTIILGAYDPEVRPTNSLILEQNAGILEAVVTEAGESLDIHRLPLPWNDTEVWFTYTNSLIVNDVVLIPVFDGFGDEEAEALAAYEAAAPQLSQVTINSDAIIPAGGAIHCVTMTVPKGVLAPLQPAVTGLCEGNDLKDCGGLGSLCLDLPYEGACDHGDLKYCGSDGYPHVLPCHGCCGFAASGLGGAGWYDCLATYDCGTCVAQCDSGESGCSYLGTHSWSCSKGPSGCLERVYDTCSNGKSCNPSTAICETKDCGPDGCPPACGECDVAGARRCSDAGLVEICQSVADGCYEYIAQPECPEGLMCLDGTCAPPLPEPLYDDVFSADYSPEANVTGGGGCCNASADGSGGWALLLLVAGLLVGRMSWWASRSASGWVVP
jgi:agmatine/peptidylarginine deiminase